MGRDFLSDELVKRIVLEVVHIDADNHAIIVVHHMKHNEVGRETGGVLSHFGGFNTHHSIIGRRIVHEEFGRTGIVGITERNEVVRLLTSEESRICVIYSELECVRLQEKKNSVGVVKLTIMGFSFPLKMVISMTETSGSLCSPLYIIGKQRAYAFKINLIMDPVPLVIQA